MPVEVYRPLPPTLTAPLPEPAPPQSRCHFAGGQPAVCVGDALAWIEAWRGVLRLANADRADAAAISAQPKENTGG